MRHTVILGAAVTGAKFTPTNHAQTGNPLIDLVATGHTIKSDIDALASEAAALYNIGVRYYHYHARNPATHEQTTDNETYAALSLAIQDRLPGMLLSFGASRNGPEVRSSIKARGEWERISQANMPVHQGGAHFVTMQAAVELQIILDLERKGIDTSIESVSSKDFVRAANSYSASSEQQSAKLEVHSTAKGGAIWKHFSGDPARSIY